MVEKTKPGLVHESGNLFHVPKVKEFSMSFLDDPNYEIDYGNDKFDYSSNKWEERKENYNALYEHEITTVDQMPFGSDQGILDPLLSKE